MKHSDPLERATHARELGETWDDEQFKETREKDLRQRTADVRSAVIAAVSCLLLATLLTSAKIVEIAERQEFGTARDRQLAVAEQVDRVSNFFSLNRPYDAIQAIRGTGDDVASRIDTIDEVIADLDLGIDDPPADPPVPDAPVGPVGPDSTSTTSTTTTVPAWPIRTVDATRPLTVFVAGDSQAKYLADAVTTESSFAFEVEQQHEISTSLSRPDYFNWPARLREVDESQDPEAVVLFIGANDHQDMTDSDGGRLVEGTDIWQAEWRRRLEITFDLLEQDGRHIFWVTQPPMRDGELDDGISQINALANAVIAERDFVSAIDIWPLFGGESGFSERVTGPDGDEIRARIDDGVHLTRDASSWVADMVFAAMSDTWEFE
jgi:lysophospholipase L1-like esterase